MPKISVIVPIYNVEQYIERCVVSLFEQNIDDIEYVFVNDCTPDNSMQILQNIIERYPERKSNIKIINHEINRGSAAAKNTGLSYATGEYIGWCDSDDWIEKDMYKSLYDKAKNDNSDIVICDFCWDTTDECKIIKQKPRSNTPYACIKHMFRGLSWILCNKLIKRKLFVEYDIKTIEGADMGEDMCVIFKIFAVSSKISYLPFAYYHYVQNSNSITHNISIEIVRGLLLNIQSIIDYYKINKIFQQFVPWIYFWILNQKKYIFKLDKEYWYLWNQTLPVPQIYKLRYKIYNFYCKVKSKIARLIKK